MHRCSPVVTGLLVVFAAQGCSDRHSTPAPEPHSTPAPQPPGAVSFATFEGVGNLVDGTLTITSVTPLTGAALTEIPGRRPGTHAPDTVEVVTDPATVREVAAGCGTMADFEGQVSVRSYYAGATLRDVYAEITSLTPSGYEACNSDAPAFGLQATLGLWSYGTVPPGGSVPRTWKFKLPSNTVTFYFKGRVMASVVRHCPGGVALAGPPASYFSSYGVTYPSAVAVGDVNKDGKLDAVIASDQGSTMTVLLGNGDGTFRTPVTYTVDANPRAVALGDLDQDGALDAVTANWGSRSISVLKGNGDGTFAPATSLSTGTFSTSQGLAVADLTGDSFPEIVVGLSGYVGVLSNTAGTIGGLGTTPVPGYYAGPLLLTDLNGDGRADLAAVMSDKVGVLLSDGAGGFRSAVQYPIPLASNGYVDARALIAADLTGDGRPELIVSNGSQTGAEPTLIAVFRNGGAGGFGPADAYPVSGGAQALASGDFDGDGLLDVAVTASDRGTVSVLLNGGAGALGAEVVYAALQSPAGLAAGRFTASGRADLLAVTGGMAVVLPNLGTGVFPARPALETGTILDSTPVAVAMADLDGDLRQDAIVLNSGYDWDTKRSDYTMGVYLGRGDGSFAAPAIYATPNQGMAVAAGDLDRDGHVDVVVVENAQVDIYRGSPGGALSAPVIYPIGSAPYRDVAVADLNGDGWPDLAIPNYANVLVLLNRGDGTFPPAPAAYATNGASAKAVAVADFNHDGAPDIVAMEDGDLCRLRNNGNGTFTRDGAIWLSRVPVAILAVDVENDGWPDLAIADFDAPTRGLGILPNGKTTDRITFGSGIGYGLPFGALTGIAAGDLDGDGFADIVAATAGGQAGVYFNTGTGAFAPMLPYPITLPSALDIALADLDGDFRPDVVELEGTVKVGRHRLVSALSSCLP